MLHQPKFRLNVILILSLLMGLSYFSFAQNKGGIKNITDYTSIAKISGTQDGKNITYFNPITNQNSTNFAGTFKGTLNGTTKYFYCIDLGNYLVYNEDYWDEGHTPSEITYILNNYFPYKSGYAGQLSTTKEAASIQLAIWHFSDGVDVNTISNDADVKFRAIAIVNDAIANHNNVKPVETLMILPASASYAQGTPASFLVFAFDIDGNPVPNVTIQLSTTLGSLSTSSVITDADGKGGPVNLTYSGIGSATIKAKADVVIPQGTRYVHKTNPNGKQKLVLATPAFDTKEVTGKVEWHTPAECDLKGYATYTQGGWGSPSNSGPGQIRDMYFDNVFPSGLIIGSTYKLTLTSATAVKNFLPQGGTAAAFTQNYNNPTSTSAGVLAGQVVALKLNVNYSAAGYLGSNTIPLGSLQIVSGPFTGYTVNQFLAFAEQAIGGGNLNGFTFSEINDAATKINENFNEGANKGFLDCYLETKASLGDKVWEDLNKNGIQDANEPGISGVTVKLFDCNNNLIGTTTTNSNGNYLFSNLIPGDYYVLFILPSGYAFTTKDAGGDDAKDSDADINTGKTICTTLSPGENDLTWDAGLIKEECLNKIGDFVWHDQNTNGIQDLNEPGLPGITVELLDSQNNLLQSTTTNANGYYEFNNILNGTYKVRIASSNFNTGGALAGSQSEKWFLTLKDQGGNDAKDSDGDNNKTASVTVNCNNNMTIDFGFFKVCVGLEKSGPTSINVGEKITYTFTVTNCGDILLSGGANVYDPMLLPTGDHKIKYLKLYPGQSESFTYEYTTDESDCGELQNNAWVIGHPVLDGYNFGTTTVRDDDNHTVNVICQPKQADLEIKKTASKTPVQCDEQFSYTITVKNNGPDKSEGIVIYDLLPAGAIYQSHTASQGLYNSNTGFWNLGDLNSGATATLTINVKADCDEVINGTFDLGPAKDYNLFVLGDITQPSSDTQGKAAIGGNASFAMYSIGDQLPPNSGDVLIVGGHLQFTSGAVYNGNVVYGNTTNLPIDAVSIAGTLEQGSPIDFIAAKAYLESLSATISGYTANGSTTMQWGGLNLNGTDPFLNVFAVNGSDLSIANNVSITVPNGSVVLINVNGTTVNWTGGLTVSGTSIGNVLYNFYEATLIKIQGIDIRGSLLAPKAHVNFAAGVINGQMICKSFEGMGQMNLAPFNGNIPYEKEVTNIALVHSVLTNDPNGNNNSASATVLFSNIGTGNNGNGNNNNGNEWQEINGFANGEIVYSLIYNSGKIYAGTWGGKIYMSANNGQTWTLINSNMGVGYIWSLLVSNGSIFAATELGVYKYNGSNWAITTLAGMDVHALATDGSAIYAGTWGLGIFKSTDNGATWTAINNGLNYSTTITSLTIQGSTLFCGTVGGGVFKSINGGANWTQFTVGNNMIWSLGSTASAIFASSFGDGLYRSLDNGATWNKLDLNVPFIYSIATNGSGKIYIASWASGVFESTDNGNNWTSLGMGGLGVSSVMVSNNSDNLFVGTKEGKIFLSMGQGVTSVDDNSELPATVELSQNYPNPFNPATTIQFALPEAGKFNLKVYNILGQEVVTLIDGEMSAGIHKVNFDASRIASGVYIYKLVGSNVNISKKMILMK